MHVTLLKASGSLCLVPTLTRRIKFGKFNGRAKSRCDGCPSRDEKEKEKERKIVDINAA